MLERTAHAISGGETESDSITARDLLLAFIFVVLGVMETIGAGLLGWFWKRGWFAG